MQAIIPFLVSQFLWALTYGFYQVLFSVVAMFFLFKWWERLSLMKSFMLSVTAHIIAVILLIVVVKIGIIDIYNYEYSPISPEEQPYNPWIACLSLAATYACIESAYFILFSMRYKWLHLSRSLIIVIMSNLIAAVLVYKFLPTY